MVLGQLWVLQRPAINTAEYNTHIHMLQTTKNAKYSKCEERCHNEKSDHYPTTGLAQC